MPKRNITPVAVALCCMALLLTVSCKQEEQPPIIDPGTTEQTPTDADVFRTETPCTYSDGIISMDYDGNALLPIYTEGIAIDQYQAVFCDANTLYAEIEGTDYEDFAYLYVTYSPKDSGYRLYEIMEDQETYLTGSQDIKAELIASDTTTGKGSYAAILYNRYRWEREGTPMYGSICLLDETGKGFVLLAMYGTNEQAVNDQCLSCARTVRMNGERLNEEDMDIAYRRTNDIYAYMDEHGLGIVEDPLVPQENDPTKIKPWSDNIFGSEFYVNFAGPTASVSVGHTIKLSYSTNGTAEQVTLHFTSSDPKVATVDDTGTVTALKAGETEIVVTTQFGSCSTCIVTVR